MIILKLATISPLMYLWNLLWDDSIDGEYFDMRHEWGVTIMFAYNCFATGMIAGNILELNAVMQLQETWYYA